MALQFDRLGYLIPAQPIATSLDEFETIFVKPFPESSGRKRLFEVYLNYVTELKKLIGTFDQWIDGSFVSTNPKPRDIDILTFISWEKAAKFSEGLLPFKKSSLGNFAGVDPYFIEFYPQSHNRRTFYESDRAYWLNLFSETRKNRRGKRFNKGFLKLTVT